MKKSSIIIVLVLLMPILFCLVGGIFFRWFYIFDMAVFYYAYERNSYPINFYGKVIDSSGLPIEDATIQIRIITIDYGFLFGGDSTIQEIFLKKQTDKDGLFQIEGFKGSSVGIEISKDGYISRPTENDLLSFTNTDTDEWYFKYYPNPPESVYVPDKSNPAIFPLYKIGEPITSQPSRGGKP